MHALFSKALPPPFAERNGPLIQALSIAAQPTFGHKLLGIGKDSLVVLHYSRYHRYDCLCQR